MTFLLLGFLPLVSGTNVARAARRQTARAGKVDSAQSRATQGSSHGPASPRFNHVLPAHETRELEFDLDKLSCLPQRPQDFLIRSNWFKRGSSGEILKGREAFQRAVTYRTEQYGYFRGFGKQSMNAYAPGHYARKTTFFGHDIIMHEKVVPALKCVEKALRESGKDKDYKIGGIGGLRFHNTYHGGEVSNHVYGIAIDIDSGRNTCCGCVGNWNKHPLCRRKGSVFNRTALPPSWVDTFENQGFYWLGHDPMEDTMHFEFLGDPDKVLAKKKAEAKDVTKPPENESKGGTEAKPDE